MGGAADSLVHVTGQRAPCSSAGFGPANPDRAAPKRSIAGVGKLAAGRSCGSLIHYPANCARKAGRADTIEDHLHDGPLPPLVVAGLVKRSGGEALDRLTHRRRPLPEMESSGTRPAASIDRDCCILGARRGHGHRRIDIRRCRRPRPATDQGQAGDDDDDDDADNQKLPNSSRSASSSPRCLPADIFPSGPRHRPLPSGG